MVVDIEDVNDVPPRFSLPEWTLDVSESLGPDHVLATLTVVDPDATNDFAFRVTILHVLASNLIHFLELFVSFFISIACSFRNIHNSLLS